MGMPKFKDFSKSDMKEINELFTPYLFYETTPKGNRIFECSHCNSIFEVGFKRLTDQFDFELITSGHNDIARCPKCGRVCTVKNKGKAKSCKNLYEEKRVVVLKRINENYVQAIAKIACKQYSEYNHRPNIQFLTYNQSRYIFRPGKVTQYKNSYYGWYKLNTASEPFTLKNSSWIWYTIPDNSYNVIGIKVLKNTF